MDREETLLFLERRLKNAAESQAESKARGYQSSIHFWIGYETAIKTAIEYIKVCQS